MNYILGYKNPESEELTQYLTKEEASYDSEEWVVVEANSLEEAKENYEEAFEKWRNKR